MSPTVSFVLASLVALASSALLVTRLERVGVRLGLSEAILGLTTALAANAPEITSALTALARGQRVIGVAVVLGSNVFNLAALLGLGALVAGRIDLHRRVVLLVGGVSMWIALVTLGTVSTIVPIYASIPLVLLVFVPYVMLSARPHSIKAIGIPARIRKWMRAAIREEEAEIAGSLDARPGNWRDAALGFVALVLVVLASIVMEHSATTMGMRLGWSSIVIGGLVLAGVTSLPNVVAAIYFAMRGRGSAVLSEALNSNNLNALVGFMLPAAIVGLHHPGSSSVVVATFYLGLTAVALSMTYLRHGLGRLAGAMIIAVYLVFVLVVAFGLGSTG